LQMNTHVRSCICTHSPACTLALVHMRGHAVMNMCTHAHAHVLTYTRALMHMHMLTSIYTCTGTNLRMCSVHYTSTQVHTPAPNWLCSNEQACAFAGIHMWTRAHYECVHTFTRINSQSPFACVPMYTISSIILQILSTWNLLNIP
jgi:hypothetical protein